MLTYARFDFVCRFEKNTHLPLFKGSMLRGALGHALKKTVCAVREKICEKCLLRQNCIYARIFEFKKTQGPEAIASGMPHPYVLEIQNPHQQEITDGESWVFSLILFGEQIELLPYFIYAVEQMGHQGVGKPIEGERSKFVLERVEADGNLLYSLGSNAVKMPIPQHPIYAESNGSKPNPQQLRLTLQTPLRMKDQGRFVNSLDFPLVTRAMLRRLKTLWTHYSNDEFPINEPLLHDSAKTIQLVKSRLHWKDQNRYSSRQKNSMQFGGLIGEIKFEGDLTPFLPLLNATQITHIGKQTSFGLGQFEYQLES